MDIAGAEGGGQIIVGGLVRRSWVLVIGKSMRVAHHQEPNWRLGKRTFDENENVQKCMCDTKCWYFSDVIKETKDICELSNMNCTLTSNANILLPLFPIYIVTRE